MKMHTVIFQNHRYLISEDPKGDDLQTKLSKADFTQYLILLEEVQKNSKKAYASIKEFYQKYSNIPEIANLLTYAHVHNKNIPEAEKLIELTWQKHPDYFIGKINYADLCLRKKEFHKIPKLFPSFSLAKLFPKKPVFHIAEFRSFMVLMGWYHLAIHKKNEATEYLRAVQEIEPNHRSVMYLEKKLFSRFLFHRFLHFLCVKGK